MSVLAQLVEQPKPPVQPPEQMREEGDWVDVIPYNAYNDPMCGHFMHWLWLKLQEEGLLALYYPDAARDEKLYPTFVRMLSSDTTHVILVVLKAENGEVKDVIGFSTWEPIKFGPSLIGHCGFIFRKNYWHRRTSIEAGHRIMRWWFEEAEPKLDVALGLIARDNLLACRYVKALGWEQTGWLHNSQQYEGKTCDALMFQYTREQFESQGKAH